MAKVPTFDEGRRIAVNVAKLPLSPSRSNVLIDGGVSNDLGKPALETEPMQVLIYGPRKSGTTLLQRLIDGGELLVPPDETKIKHLPSLSKDDYRTYVIEEVKTKTSNYSNAGLKGWAIKEVGGTTVSIIQTFFAAFPEGRVVQICRDPRFVARAVYRNRMQRGVKLSMRDCIKQAWSPWKVLFAQEQLSRDPRIYTLWYEDLLIDTEREMKEVCAFLGIQFGPIHTRPTLDGEAVVVKTASENQKAVFNLKPRLRDGIGWLQLSCIIGVACVVPVYRLRRFISKDRRRRILEKSY